ncbi:MAG: hypothetical protein QGH24_03600, partial [Candidatus Marinimicrobia bacterium]|nr:hypothetical protein [Candidatus Neomarinimicrobiota bacterium]
MKNISYYFVIFVWVSNINSQSIFPDRIELNEKSNLMKSLSPGLRSNGISEIILQRESTVWLGTGRGISYLEDSLFINTLDTLMLKNGGIHLLYDGISGIAVYEDHLLSAG